MEHFTNNLLVYTDTYQPINNNIIPGIIPANLNANGKVNVPAETIVPIIVIVDPLNEPGLNPRFSLLVLIFSFSSFEDSLSIYSSLFLYS